MPMNKDGIHQTNLELWDRTFASRPWGRYPPEELVRFVSRTFGRAPDRGMITFLEVGCGPGANIWYLVREGYTVAGIDGSPTAIRQSRERLQADGLLNGRAPIDLRQGDFGRLPWPAASFDVVIDIEAIYANEVGVIRSCIDEIHRVLKPGGIFFGKMFGPKTTGYKTGIETESNTFDNVVEGPCAGFGASHFFTESELHLLFSGFSTFDLDWVHRSDLGRKIEVFEWLVTARKL